MKSMFMNYFKEGNLYQWDKNKDILMITKTDIQEEFCLDQKGMEMFLKFENPEIKLGNDLYVKSGKVKAHIKVYDETLTVPDMEVVNTIKLDVNKLKIANKFVATSGNPILTGVNIKDGYINATDSYFAYRSECKAECNVTLTTQFINVLTSLNGEVELKLGKTNVFCEVGDTTYIGRLLAGNYPTLERVYNSNKEINEVEIDKKELKQLLTYANKNDYVILDNNKLIIKGDNNLEATIDLPITERFCLTFERVIAVLNSVETDKLKVNYSIKTEIPALTHENI